MLCVISIFISLKKSDNFPEIMAKKRSRGHPTLGTLIKRFPLLIDSENRPRREMEVKEIDEIDEVYNFIQSNKERFSQRFHMINR